MNRQMVFSLLLVVRNEEVYIEKLLEAALNQDFPKEQYEIVVVDGESTDRTKEIVDKYIVNYPNRIRYFTNSKKVLCSGWNIGIKKARGTYVVRVDGHTLLSNDFLTNNYEAIKHCPDAACVGGVIKTEGLGFWGKVNSYVFSHPFGVGNSKFRITKKKWEGYVDTVPYGAYKKEIFKKVGYFNEDLKRIEDLELHARIRNNGGKFYLSTSINTIYYARNTLKTLLEKTYSDGKWNIIAASHGSGVLRFRHIVPLIVVLSSFIILGISFVNPMFFLALCLLALTYFSLVGYFSINIIKEHGAKYYFPTMLSFFLLHFGRGFGSISGIIKVYFGGKSNEGKDKVSDTSYRQSESNTI